MRLGADNAMATQQSAKKVVLGTPACAALCERAKQLRLRVVHAGVITFADHRSRRAARSTTACPRTASIWCCRFSLKDASRARAADFEKLLAGRLAWAEAFSEKGQGGGRGPGHAGSVVFVLEDESERPPAAVAWRGLQGLRAVFAGKEDRCVLRSRLG